MLAQVSDEMPGRGGERLPSRVRLREFATTSIASTFRLPNETLAQPLSHGPHAGHDLVFVRRNISLDLSAALAIFALHHSSGFKTMMQQRV